VSKKEQEGKRTGREGGIRPIYSIVLSEPAMGFPNPSRLMRAASDASHIGLPARGDGICETADEPTDPRALYIEENDDPM
jgi:hypothetical protein